MKTYIAFLRGINVGGNNMIAMKDLANLCGTCGLSDVRTYINTGNVIFKSDIASKAETKIESSAKSKTESAESALEQIIEKALAKKVGKDIKVIVRSLKDLAAIVANNPFPKGIPSQIGVLLTKENLSKKAKSLAVEFIIPGREEVKIGKSEVYIHYADGMGRSKLKAPKSLADNTMRNINTLNKLVEMASSVNINT